MLFRVEPAEGAHGQVELLARGNRLLADRPGGDLDVLVLDGADDVCGRQVARGQLIRVKPQTNAVVALTKQQDVADPLDAKQLVLELDGGEIAHVDAVIAAVRREQVDGQQDLGRRFLGIHTLELHLRRQLRQGQGDAVLDEHLGDVHIGTDLERDCQRVVAVVGGLRRHVQHALDAVDLLLDRGGDRVGDHLGVGAG